MKYSIIIPHYNSVASLKKLLSTIPERADTEVIVVDDGSDESVWEQLTAMPQRFNVRILQTKHAGAGKARNIGLDTAVGEKIIFADADDYFCSSLDKLLTAHREDIYDIAFFRIDSVCSETNRKADRHIWFQKMVDDARLSPTPHHRDRLLLQYTPPWGKIYSAKFLKKQNIRFEEIMITNDLLFSVYAGLKAKEVAVFDELLYVVTVTPGSLITRKTPEMFLSSFHTILKVNDFLRAAKKRRYQFSVLYYVGTAYRYGIRYEWIVLKTILKKRSNILIGLNHLFRHRKVLKRHGEYPSYMR